MLCCSGMQKRQKSIVLIFRFWKICVSKRIENNSRLGISSHKLSQTVLYAVHYTMLQYLQSEIAEIPTKILIEMWYLMNKIITYSIVSMEWKAVFDTSWYYDELVSFFARKIQAFPCVHTSFCFCFFVSFCLAIKYTVIRSQNICFFFGTAGRHPLFNMSIEFCLFAMLKKKTNETKSKRTKKNANQKKSSQFILYVSPKNCLIIFFDTIPR